MTIQELVRNAKLTPQRKPQPVSLIREYSEYKRLMWLAGELPALLVKFGFRGEGLEFMLHKGYAESRRYALDL